jgi:hypothetical protein
MTNNSIHTASVTNNALTTATVTQTWNSDTNTWDGSGTDTWDTQHSINQTITNNAVHSA